MEKLLTPETFEFFAKYLLAGFVMLHARSWLVAGERPRPNEALFEAVILSLFNQLVATVTLGWLREDPPGPTPTYLLFAEVIAQPIVLGMALGRIGQFHWLPDWLRRLFAPSIKPVTDAFDFAFDTMSPFSFLIVTFNDGRIVYGYFASRSMASIDQYRGGIYLERLYNVDEDDQWHEAAPQRTTWLSLSDVRSIEFIPAEEPENVQDTL